jgi:hypothetical protein
MKDPHFFVEIQKLNGILKIINISDITFIHLSNRSNPCTFNKISNKYYEIHIIKFKNENISKKFLITRLIQMANSKEINIFLKLIKKGQSSMTAISASMVLLRVSS